MPKTVHKSLAFPLAGVIRRAGYRVQSRPYSAPWAVNVRGKGALESRDRGGSRPGLVKVSETDFGTLITAISPLVGVDESGDRRNDLIVAADGSLSILRASVVSSPAATLQTSGGVAITTDDGTEIEFSASVSAVNAVGGVNPYGVAQKDGSLLIAESTLKVYNPDSGACGDVTATTGTVPAAMPLVCVYRDRVILAGVNHIWYASRQSNMLDWDYGADIGDAGRAVAGELAYGGQIGEVPRALIPIGDRALVFACDSSLWVLKGDPVTGTLINVSESIGIIAPGAWAVSPEGTVAFLSHDGVYLWTEGSATHPERFSDRRLPDELKDVDDDANTITMAWDDAGRGYHLFITPETGVGTHWWLDPEHKAFWPVYLEGNHQPIAVARVDLDGSKEVILGCRDGYLRKFSNTATDDDGVEFQSHILIGPVRMSPDDLRDAMTAELHGIMAATSCDVTWGLFAADDAETAADEAVAVVEAQINGTAYELPQASGIWEDGRNLVDRPRVRGSWIVLWLSAKGRWACEAVAVTARQLGRIR